MCEFVLSFLFVQLNEDKFFHQYTSQPQAWLWEGSFLKSSLHYCFTQTVSPRLRNFISKNYDTMSKTAISFLKNVFVIFVENIWTITLYFSWDLRLCRCSPNWLLIVLFLDVTLCRLVNRYQPHSITFQKIVHTSSAIGTVSWPAIINSKHEEILGSVSPEANLANTNF